MYTLAIADRLYSSWSLRGWLMLEKFDLPFKARHAQMRTDAFGEMLSGFGAARLVPAMKFDDVAVWDSLAMAETLAERHPDKGMWPTDPVARGMARSMVAEMHAGFGALRNDFAMNLWHRYTSVEVSQQVRSDLDRISELWAMARGHASDGPWLFGPYSLADVFYAPVAARIAGHGLPVPDFAQDYVQAHLADPAFRRWRAMGLAENRMLEHYKLNYPTAPWPGPTPLTAKAAPGPSVNDLCPYSGKPVAPDSIGEIAGVRVGFCNQFCRDKTIADPEIWPKTMAVVEVATG